MLLNLLHCCILLSVTGANRTLRCCLRSHWFLHIFSGKSKWTVVFTKEIASF